MPANGATSQGSERNGSAGAAAARYDHVTKHYPGQDSPAIQHLDLEVPAGELAAIPLPGPAE